MGYESTRTLITYSITNAEIKHTAEDISDIYLWDSDQGIDLLNKARLVESS